MLAAMTQKTVEKTATLARRHTMGQVAPRPRPRADGILNVEIDGYTLTEAIDAIGPRIKIPIYWDHTALAAAHIDPTAIKVAVPKTRTYYKRVLDRVLAQAHLAGQLRTDEAGTRFSRSRAD